MSEYIDHRGRDAADSGRKSIFPFFDVGVPMPVGPAMARRHSDGPALSGSDAEASETAISSNSKQSAALVALAIAETKLRELMEQVSQSQTEIRALLRELEGAITVQPVSVGQASAGPDSNGGDA